MCSQYALEISLSSLPKLASDNLSQIYKSAYSPRSLINPTEQILVCHRVEDISMASQMIWGFTSRFVKNPFTINSSKYFNSEVESVSYSKIFQFAWRNNRCLIPASSFFIKGYRIKSLSQNCFWLGGIWEKWIGADGSELHSCSILTTKSNKLISNFSDRMPVVIPMGFEEEWLRQRNGVEVRQLEPLLKSWDSNGWNIEYPIDLDNSNNQ